VRVARRERERESDREEGREREILRNIKTHFYELSLLSLLISIHLRAVSCVGGEKKNKSSRDLSCIVDDKNNNVAYWRSFVSKSENVCKNPSFEMKSSSRKRLYEVVSPLLAEGSAELIKRLSPSIFIAEEITQKRQ
jgi:hypothetical protein